MSEKVVLQLLQPYATAAGVPGIAPHDLRRSCAKMCRAAGGELEQIQLLLGHASVQTTERYLGTRQDLGRSIAQNYVEAVKWYRKAAGQGNPDAQYDLGVCYYRGQGVAKTTPKPRGGVEKRPNRKMLTPSATSVVVTTEAKASHKTTPKL